MSPKQTPMKKLISVFIAVLGLLHYEAVAQQATHKANLDKVSAKGFYLIHLPNEIRQFAEPSLSDVRILNAKNKQVPYRINEFNLQEETSNFESFTYSNSNNSEFIIEKGGLAVWNYIILKVKNANITKYYTLSGSNNKKDWFVLTDTNRISLGHNAETSTLQKISFPNTDYQYIKLNIDNKQSPPIAISAIGYDRNYLLLHDLDPIKPDSVHILNDAIKKTSTIHIQFKQAQQINQIKWVVSNPSYFNRQAIVYKKTTKIYKKKPVERRETLAAFSLDSKSNLVYDIAVWEQDFYIEIANNDNPELEIDTILFFQEPKYLVAELAPNESYSIQCGNKKLEAPIYDIAHLHELNNAPLPEVKVQPVLDLRTTEVKEKKTKPFYEEPWFMWTCMAIGMLSLAFFSISLLKDTKK